MSGVAIRYHRPLRGTTVFRQQYVHHEHDCTVTLMRHSALTEPVRVHDRVILEPGAPVVWFTFEGAWHDIGRFHSADGAFNGYYANILTPVVFHSTLEWETTDLCLDVWFAADGSLELLDEDELDAAVAARAVTHADARAARAEARRLLDAARAGSWPPAIVDAWPLERALRHVGTRT